MARTDSPNTTNPSSILGAHAHLVERLRENKPAPLRAWFLADAHDFEDRAEHLRTLLIAVGDYVQAAVNDIASYSNAPVDKKCIAGCLADLGAEVVGSLSFTAED